MLVVLVVASGAAWESSALKVLGEDPNIVVLKRCVDVDDLLASAASGQAQAAVVGLGTPGLDANAVDRLRAEGVRPVAVVEALHEESARLRAGRVGIGTVIVDDALADLPSVLASNEGSEPVMEQDTDVALDQEAPPVATAGGRTIVVWGVAGAPGRSTLAAGIAAELANRAEDTTLIDADPYGGTLAQRLGVLDEASGLLTSARLSTSGDRHAQFATCARRLDDHLCFVSGLPRADRWVELRPGAVEHLLDAAAHHGHVVVDTGFSLEQEAGADLGPRTGRDQATIEALGAADEIVVVGSADPVGLSRLARGLVDLQERLPDGRVRVVINRMRPTLGWSEDEISALVSDFGRLVGLCFVPDDPETVDRALATGRSLIESGDSPIVRAIAAIVDQLVDRPGAGIRRRRAGTSRRR